MTPGARVQAAIEILDAWRAGSEGVDRVLAGWGRTHRFAGSGDRRAIADLVYDALRRKRSAAWVAGADDQNARALLRGSLELDGQDPNALFTGVGHAPLPLSEPEHVIRDLEQAARAVQLDIPDWLEPLLAGVSNEALEALRHRATVDLRVNLLKTTTPDAVAALSEEGILVSPVDLSPTALRVESGARKVARSAVFQDGLVEVQDAASQAVADLAAARPGEIVLDLCAGGGGKTLALAASMGRKGRLLAHDISPERMKDLPDRAARAGAEVEIVTSEQLSELKGACDLVFVDAPCSGSGAWRRNPDAKWRLTMDRLAELGITQSALLDQAAMLCAPGGRIVYATCSILARENGVPCEAFVERCPGWQLIETRQILPPEADGFFAAVLSRGLDSAWN